MSKLLLESTPERWRKIRTHSFYKPIIEEIKKQADESITTETPMLKYSEFMLFFTTGDRNIYQNSLSSRRRKLISYAIMYLVTKESKYLSALEDIVWAVCDEYTWSLPAHLFDVVSVDKQRKHIDLCAAEMGYALSEMYYLIGEDFSPLLRERIKFEVKERVINSFLNREQGYSWESVTNNWAAVCAGSVGNAIMYMGDEKEFEAALPRLLNAMESFLLGFNDDGACLEGYEYWVYGFGFFLQFADLLRQYTQGEIDLLNSEKIRNIALFQQKVILGNNKCVSFSDGSSTFEHELWITHFLYKNFRGIEIPDIRYRTHFGDNNRYRFGSTLRNLLWTDETLPNCTLSPKSYYLPNAGWFIKNTSAYSFAAKAGHNDEPHNHNDIGSFILSINNEIQLSDLGVGEYVNDYFDDEKRYGFLVNGSQGHSVPVIDGQHQSAGAEYCGKVVDINDNLFSINIEKAYDIEYLKNLKRTFEIFDNEIIIKDTFLFDKTPNSVRERFVTLIEPSLDKGKVTVGDLSAEFDETQFNCSILTETYSGHSGIPTTAYIIEFDVINPQKEIECKFKLKFCAK